MDDWNSTNGSTNDGDPVSEPGAPAAECAITSPANGDVKGGPQNGVTIVVEGTAKIVSGAGVLQRIEVQFGPDPAPFEQATNVSGSWTTWTHSKLIATSGTLPITARAAVDGQALATRTITIKTELSATPSTDTTPPSIGITAPKQGTAVVVSSTNPVETLDVAGTASDLGSGVAKVELTVDGAPAKVMKVGTKWDHWTAKVSVVGIGRHTISARATDAAGLATTSSVDVVATTEPVAPPAVERLLIVEKLQLSTYLGRFGVGRLIKTLTLLPGQKTTLAVKTYKRSAETTNEASSILDETSAESLKEFENELKAEQTNKQVFEESNAWTLSGQASAFWGGGSASISGGASGSTNAAREELATSLRRAVQKQTSKASSKRVVEIKTSQEMKKEEGEEFSSESHIENINVSRPLTFLFSMINQEFVTLLHLVNFRVAYVRGDLVQGDTGQEMRWTYREVTLSQLDGLLRQVIVPERREDVRRAIIDVMSNVFDYKDEWHKMIEERELKNDAGNIVGSYLRVPQTSQLYELEGQTIRAPGVILAEMRNVMRTDGIVCEAVLAKNGALDAYSDGLQREAVEARELENARQRELVNKERLAIKLIKDSDAERAKIYTQIFPPPEHESLALVTTNAAGNGTGG